jgi:hypothetical protein
MFNTFKIFGSRPAVNYKKGCTRLTAASDKFYQLLAHGLWFSPGTPASSTIKTGRHDMAGILLKVALKINQSINQVQTCSILYHGQATGKIYRLRL